MDRGIISARLAEIVATYIGCSADEIPLEASLYHDLKISGDDARDMLEMIAHEFGISFDDDFNIDKRFPTERNEVSALFWLKRKLGRGEEFIFTTFSDLLEYVSRKILIKSKGR